MKKFVKCAVFFFFTAFMFVSCKDKVMGYSVVLWNLPEYFIQDGDTVPVYIRSNISSVYVIGLEDGKKVEVPLWKLTDPVKKGKILESKTKYAEFAHQYASVKLDGLPCRAEPINTSKQVYRLRKGEVIKLLYKTEGQAVMAGKKALEGDWFRILTSDGTFGYCFSYNLNIFETDITGKQISGEVIEEEEEVDEKYETVTKTIWYPDYYKTMINSGNIDLTKLYASYNFSFDLENKKVNLNLPKIHESWDYKGYRKTGDKEYKLDDIPLVIHYKRSDYIVARYTGSDGKPQDLNFVKIDGDISAIISAEKERRTNTYAALIKHGTLYTSSNYGQLMLTEDGTFRWLKNKLLVPAIISASARNVGTVNVKYAVAKSLASSYDGVLTFKFDGMNEEVNFLYKKEAGALRLEDATSAKIDGNLVKERGASPLILYFKITK
ncbi:MAG: SH3 domain-containing protein [Treponema sp.]|nr:SH3 domain-containing protein [Treponema sp.]